MPPNTSRLVGYFGRLRYSEPRCSPRRRPGYDAGSCRPPGLASSQKYLSQFATPAEKAAHSSVYKFAQDYKSGNVFYHHGPNNFLTGSDSGGIENAALAFIEAQSKAHPDEPLDLVGHSRGGYIVTQIAAKLKDHCPPIRIRFMGLYDAVDSAPGSAAFTCR